MALKKINLACRFLLSTYLYAEAYSLEFNWLRKYLQCVFLKIMCYIIGKKPNFRSHLYVINLLHVIEIRDHIFTHNEK